MTSPFIPLEISMSQPTPSIRRWAIAALFLTAASAAAQAAPPAWVAKSDQNTQIVLEALARVSPESAAALGISGLDEEIFDLTPGFDTRATEESRKVRAELARRLAAETDPPVRQDLQILIDSIDSELQGTALGRRHSVPYFNLSRTT